MSMNIGEASAVATILKTVTGNVGLGDYDMVRDALHTLNERAGKPLGLTKIITDTSQLDEAADDLVPPGRPS